MEENFKRFREYLAKDASQRNNNPIQNLIQDWKLGKSDFYQHMDSMQSFHRILTFYSQILSKTEISKIEITDNHLSFTVRDINIKLAFNGIDRTSVPFWMLNFGSYEREEMEMCGKLIDDGMTIYDVGANIGYFSLVLGKLRPASLIHAFEPVENTIKFLMENIKANGLNNVCAICCALSDANCKSTVTYSPEISALASEKNILHYENAQEIGINVITMDSWADQKVGFIKIDIEGSEFNVLKGAIKTLKKYKPIVMCELFRHWTEVYGYHPDEVIKFMSELGYRCFLPEKACLREVMTHQKGDFANYNYFFLHREAHKEKIQDNLLKHS